MLSIDGSVHKFDTATKELDFKFQASCYKQLILFNRDTRLITSDSK